MTVNVPNGPERVQQWKICKVQSAIIVFSCANICDMAHWFGLSFEFSRCVFCRAIHFFANDKRPILLLVGLVCIFCSCVTCALMMNLRLGVLRWICWTVNGHISEINEVAFFSLRVQTSVRWQASSNTHTHTIFLIYGKNRMESPTKLESELYKIVEKFYCQTKWVLCWLYSSWVAWNRIEMEIPSTI